MKSCKQASHGGDVYRNQVNHDFSINLNPLGMPKQVKEQLINSVDSWSKYPDPECEALRKALAEFHQVPMEWIFCANGAADLIYQAVRAIAPKKALLLTPSFSEYRQALLACGCDIELLPMQKEQQFQPDMEELLTHITHETDLLFFCNPNNPTGHAATRAAMKKILDRCKETKTWLILDECFCDLLEEPEAFSLVPDAGTYKKLIILRAFTKTYAMAGLRLGYAIGSQSEVFDAMAEKRQPWSVSIPAQIGGIAALKQEAYLTQARDMIRTERKWLITQLKRLGLMVFDSDSNFILFYIEEKNPGDLLHACLGRGILLRDCSNFDGLKSGYYRICVGKPEENLFLIRNLGEIIDEK